ncbi:hypothetical protein D8B22_08145 [Verminephrobacter aporrectodeae subsp. tuberculatae]|uniref:cupredoxin domain-containing protein n=1 Tax=Verminephrobacter aporrectodeae TaxID=1110389 RepID=UPI0022439393|nr:cupredoxin family protein [Verminephrobacter aporrectodeae]MCW8165773.1 hypothetical protein [Verminephrobacter aporrectodeae subsp. tuberculatae]MCW8169081.1 hypothetical protein [Verminephrobacter aporrectodeae subsp. tuberculatae]
MRTMHFIAAATVWVLGVSASAAPAHGDAAHHGAHAPALKKVQKAWGIAGDARAVVRTIRIRMTDDMRFTPDRIEVREGETLRLRAENKGQVQHEIVIGTAHGLEQHAEMMQKNAAMEHGEPHMAHVSAGRKGDIVWTFNRPGSFAFACLVPGHAQAGMIGSITVLPRKR